MNFEAIQRVEQLTETDIAWLTKGCQKVTFRTLDPMTLIHRMLKGELIMVRIVGEGCEGIACLTPDHVENELWIDLYSGKNIMSQELRELLKKMAKVLGLKKLTGYVGRQALGKWYDENVRAKPVAMLYVEEID